MKRRYTSSRNKFSDFLTVLLVVVIIAILALIGFFGYKAVSKKAIEVGSQEAYETFQNSVRNKVTQNNVTNEVEPEPEPENAVENETGENSSLSELAKPTNTTEPLAQQQGGQNKPAKNPNKQYYEGYEVMGSISIPKTGINYVILEKVTPKSLAAAPAILDIVGTDSMSGTIKSLNVPGTNALILGHNYRNGLFFSDNHKLQLGDQIIITDQSGLVVSYTIYDMYYTDASDADFMLRDLDPNVREITLQTCNDDSSQRLIILAKDK